MAHITVVRSGPRVAAGIAASKWSETEAGWEPTQRSYREQQHKGDRALLTQPNTGSLLSKPTTAKSISCYHFVIAKSDRS